MSRIYRLLRNDIDWSEEVLRELVRIEYKKDAKGKEVMTIDDFIDSLFEVVDIW